MSNSLNNSDIYNEIDKFLSLSGISRRKFAIEAGINVGTFQNLMTRKSKISAVNCSKIIHCVFDNLNKFHGSELYDELSQTADLITHLCDKEIVSQLNTPEQRERFKSQLFFQPPKEFIDKAPDYMIKIFPERGDDPIFSIVAIYDNLNFEGRMALLEQANLINEIPKYQNQNKKIPPENGQDDN